MRARTVRQPARVGLVLHQHVAESVARGRNAELSSNQRADIVGVEVGVGALCLRRHVRVQTCDGQVVLELPQRVDDAASCCGSAVHV